MPKQYKEEFKKQAVAYYEQCHSLCMVADKYQVAPSTVNRWVNEHKNLAQSFSFTGRPHDNAVAEAFFSSFKQEENTGEIIHQRMTLKNL